MLQFHYILYGPMEALDLPLGPGMIRCPSSVPEAMLLEVFLEFSSDIAWSIIRQQPGYHQVQWDGKTISGRSVPSGIYIARLATPEFRNMKLVLLK
ncbi:MAG: hypothetical protein GH142_00110 [Dehalococcoidia bacterium]|nr:hypothetical protein [Dehalococcoidia bacterium]